MKKPKYCETFKRGYYLSVLRSSRTGEIIDERAYYLTGTTKGNKWIALGTHAPQWMGLVWNCIRREDFELPNNEITFHGEVNPTQYPLQL